MFSVRVGDLDDLEDIKQEIEKRLKEITVDVSTVDVGEIES